MVALLYFSVKVTKTRKKTVFIDFHVSFTTFYYYFLQDTNNTTSPLKHKHLGLMFVNLNHLPNPCLT